METTMVFPLVLLISFMLLFVSLFMWRSAQLELRADAAAERAAYNWDNSYRESVSGAYSISNRDGLYWRTSLSELSSLFRLSSGSSSKLTLPAFTGEGLGLSQRKLFKQTMGLTADTGGTLTYKNSLLERSVQVSLNRASGIPKRFGALLPEQSAGGSAISYVTEPAEFIRNLDLLTSYATRLYEYLNKKDAEPLDPFSEDKPAPYIDSEAKAKVYVQELVNGKPKAFPTSTAGKERQYDAVDPDGIAHDAKYTVNKKDALEQIQKDVELIKSGKIKGCVWHFFQVKKNNKGADLTPALRKELEENGIVIVIHEL
ncbi:hypothetical protein [Gorillibacterium timonense]|uniref:hypothetical protein n=1 Tax=Gorillibacterium timonense TaxID=1689269 RepID=UPI00071E53D1|nr:hypothetical protein [Gorillibacterium timonense]